MLLLVSRIDRRLGIVGGDEVVTMVWAPFLVAVGSIALGTLTYRLVEKPAMEWAGRR